MGQYGVDRNSALRTGSLPQYPPQNAEYHAGPGMTTGYSPDVGSVDSQPMFDFSLAEELLGGAGTAVQGVSVL